MKTLLIQVPYERLRGLRPNSFPTNIGQLATILEENGHHARVYNAEAAGPEESGTDYDESARHKSQKQYASAIRDDGHLVWTEIRNTIRRFRPDLVGISSMTATLPSAIKVAEISKQVYPKIPVVVGGCHAMLMPEQIAEKNPVDFVVQGEGERSLLELCNHLEGKSATDPRGIPGLVFKENGRIIKAAPPQRIEDLDALPITRRDLLLFPERHDAEFFKTIMGSRGCPYKCAFCSSPAIWGRKVRYRSAKHIIQELRYLREEFGVYQFRFWDDTFTLSKPRVVEFCKELSRSGLKLTWVCSVRANKVDDEMLREMKKAGCTSIAVGIESGSDRILAQMNKGITTAMVRKTVSLIHKYGFLVGSFWMIGLPYEEEMDVRKTIELMKELPLNRINLCTFSPEPMTELHDICVKEGLLEPETDWSEVLDISHHSSENYFAVRIPKDRYDSLIQEALEVAENVNRRTLRKRFRSIWIQRRYFLNRRVFFREINKRIGRFLLG